MGLKELEGKIVLLRMINAGKPELLPEEKPPSDDVGERESVFRLASWIVGQALEKVKAAKIRQKEIKCPAGEIDFGLAAKAARLCKHSGLRVHCDFIGGNIDFVVVL